MRDTRALLARKFLCFMGESFQVRISPFDCTLNSKYKRLLPRVAARYMVYGASFRLMRRIIVGECKKIYCYTYFLRNYIVGRWLWGVKLIVG